MKDFKKIMAVALTLVMLFAFSACGEGGEGEGEQASDLEKIQEKGKMVIGITDYEPMNYYDENGKLVGFDTEYAELVCAELGVKAEFVEIDWDNKIIELDAGNIDAIWNGMTYTEERAKELDFSKPYVNNELVVVIRKADAEKYKTKEDLAKGKIVAEGGSTSEEAVLDDEVLAKADFTPVSSLVSSLMEVSAGTADISIVDSVMANELVGKGAYEGLMIVPDLTLSTELLAIGFRKGSDLTDKVNEITEGLLINGKLQELADKYKLQLYSPDGEGII